MNAFPTAEDTVEEKVKRLSEDELANIRIPEKGGRIMFSVAIERGPGVENQDNRKMIQWLRVYADGRMVGDSSASFKSPWAVKNAEDTLSRSELIWLLHLAVNECELLKLSTEEIDGRFQVIRHKSPSEKQRRFHYGVELDSRENSLTIPEEVLVVRPLRRKMRLGAFASLNKYVVHLISRASLGDSENRQLLLDKLNSMLQAEYPDAPPFRMEHLFGAIYFTNVPVDFKSGLIATFQQEIEEEESHFRRIYGRIRQKEFDLEPEIVIWKN